MEVFNHFNKIQDLGFIVNIRWNQYIEIVLIYENSAVTLDTVVLFCSYNDNFEDIAELCCDLFYEWYNEHSEVIDAFDLAYDLSEKIENHDIIKDITLGDVSLKVSREMNLDKLL